MTKTVLIGGGGFAKEVLEIARLNGLDVVGYVGSAQGQIELPFWGNVEVLLQRRSELDFVCLAFGAIDRKSAQIRADMGNWISENGFVTPSLISPHSICSDGVKVAAGAIVAHGVVISVDARIGEFSILNTSSIIGHDAIIERNVTIAPGAFIGGNASIGENCLIGPGAIVLEGRHVGKNVVMGFGATAARNIQGGATVMPVRSRVLS